MMDGWLKTFGLLDEASSLVFYMYVVPVVFVLGVAHKSMKRYM